MSEYNPDSWVIIKITVPDQKTIYKVLGGWSGGYLDGDSWQLNSGIAKVKRTEITLISMVTAAVYTNVTKTVIKCVCQWLALGISLKKSSLTMLNLLQ